MNPLNRFNSFTHQICHYNVGNRLKCIVNKSECHWIDFHAIFHDRWSHFYYSHQISTYYYDYWNGCSHQNQRKNIPIQCWNRGGATWCLLSGLGCIQGLTCKDVKTRCSSFCVIYHLPEFPEIIHKMHAVAVFNFIFGILAEAISISPLITNCSDNCSYK